MIMSVVILATQRNNLKMKLRLTVFLVLLVIELILSSPSRRFDGVAFEKFLIKARDVLDRVPLIDG